MLNILLDNVKLIRVEFHFLEQGLEVALYIMYNLLHIALLAREDDLRSW